MEEVQVHCCSRGTVNCDGRPGRNHATTATGIPGGPALPIIDVTLIDGRPPALKAEFIRELTDAAERVLGVPRASIRVLLRELPPENWGVGGEPKSQAPR
ncbi:MULTISPECIES: tautomerase family protein [Corallococcus]|uniref:tautomerase family protein n=1 Tax=Corallococcus TaxID=83461 RepID=UPI00210679AE|nr:tautomerase family protein [Corallococcus sp. AB032C]